MKRNLSLSLIGIFAFTISCSRMVVDVQTADLKMVTAEYNKNIKDQALSNTLSKASSRGREALFNETSRYFENLKPINLISSNPLNPTLSTGYESEQISYTKNYKDGYQSKVDEIAKLYGKVILQNQEGEHKEAIQTWNNVQTLLGQLSYFSISGQIQGLNTTIYGAKQAKTVEKVQIVQDRVLKKGRSNLLGDPMVSFITKDSLKEKKLWKSLYNKTKSWTAFGNSDIAVVLNEDPEQYNNNYTIKGVRVDADQLIQSSFDMLAQSINVLATANGIPTSPENGDNYFTPTAIPQIQNLSAATGNLEKRKQLLENYRNLLIMEILGRGLDGKNTSADLIKEVDEIKLIWKSWKKNLESTQNTD